MAQLTTTDMSSVDKIFGMCGGYVLDFSRSRFAAFFNKDLQIDIYNNRYATHGGSMAKRLRALLEHASNDDAVRTLKALWEYREVSMSNCGKSEEVPNARQRLNSILKKLGGSELPPDPNAASLYQAAPRSSRPSEAVLDSVKQEFLNMIDMNEAPQKRGYAFEGFLKRWFNIWELDADASFRTKGEQIDGSFLHEANTYLVEAKWHTRPIDAAMLHGFQGKLLERPDWTRGLYVSYGGFSVDSFDAFTARRMIMMDGSDIFHALENRLDLAEIIKKKVRFHSERRQPFARVTELFSI